MWKQETRGVDGTPAVDWLVGRHEEVFAVLGDGGGTKHMI